MKMNYLLCFILGLLAGSLRVYHLGFIIYNDSDKSLIQNRNAKNNINNYMQTICYCYY